MYIPAVALVLLLSTCVPVTGHSADSPAANVTYEIDPKGYLIFCLCMGRVGNQMEHLLGGMAFAKAIDRTLVIPSVSQYRMIPITEYYEYSGLEEYHRVIPSDVFMEQIAPKIWPVGQRLAFCYRPSNRPEINCDMKPGPPFSTFWDSMGIDNFDGYVHYEMSYQSPKYWVENFTADKYPVIALKGAPAPYPMSPKNWPLQKYVRLSPQITDEADKYINDNFPGEVFVGIHLRNGIDWVRACENAVGRDSYMASPQCNNANGGKVSQNVCLPDENHVVYMTKKFVELTGATAVFVATDKHPMIKPLEDAFKDSDRKVRVFHMDPRVPQVDQHILIRSNHFIGNCVSSFTSFVTRTRALQEKPTSFFGLED